MNTKRIESLDLQELISKYKIAAIRHTDGTLNGNHIKANDAYADIAGLFKEVKKKGAQGTGALAVLLQDPELGVKVWAASHLLSLGVKEAKEVLVAIAEGPPSLLRLNAEMVLKEWHANRLHFPE